MRAAGGWNKAVPIEKMQAHHSGLCSAGLDAAQAGGGWEGGKATRWMELEWTGLEEEWGNGLHGAAWPPICGLHRWPGNTLHAMPLPAWYYGFNSFLCCCDALKLPISLKTP